MKKLHLDKLKFKVAKRVFLFLLTTLLFLQANSQTVKIKNIARHLEENGCSPADYVISKFEQYDFIFLGEHHRIKHDAEFVAKLIPKLYDNGVLNLAHEFCEYTNQVLMDSLLSMNYWDESFAYKIASKGISISWGYTEYIQIIKSAWELNNKLDTHQLKFRIICLGNEFYPCKNGYDRFGGMDTDFRMAELLTKEVISKKQKALIYCGINHAITKYKQPYYDFKNKKLIRYNIRFGNLIHEEFKEKTFTIFMHSPWPSNKGFTSPCVKPASGIIDSAMSLLNNPPIGFDVNNSITGNLKSNNSYYSLTYSNFNLKDFCDGYIFLKPFNEYKNVSVEKNFYNEENFIKIKHYLRCLGWSKKRLDELTIKKVIELISKDGNIEDRFKHLY